MIDARTKTPEPTRSPDALFAAPIWATLRLTASVALIAGGVGLLAAGAVIAIRLSSWVPVVVAVMLAPWLLLSGAILQHLTRQSTNVLYSFGPLPTPGPQQTVLVLERGLNVSGKRTEFGQDRIVVNASPDEVARMIAYVRETGNLSRGSVVAGAKVSQSTWSKVMTALSEVGAVVNNGRAGYSAADELDAMLDNLDAQL